MISSCMREASSDWGMQIVVATTNAYHLGGRQVGHEPDKGIRPYDAIGIYKPDQVVCRGPPADVACRAGPSAPPRHTLHRVFRHDTGRVIRRPVIHEDDLVEARSAIFEHAQGRRQTRPDRAAAIQPRNHQADTWPFHSARSLSASRFDGTPNTSRMPGCISFSDVKPGASGGSMPSAVCLHKDAPAARDDDQQAKDRPPGEAPGW